MIDLRFPTALQMVLSVALADQDGFRCTSQVLADGLSTNPSFIRKLLVPLTREGMIATSIGKGGGLHLGRPAAEITLRDIYRAVTEDKKLLVARHDVPIRCRISANINSFFSSVADQAEGAMWDVLGSRNVAESLSEVLRLDEERMKQGGEPMKAAGGAGRAPSTGVTGPLRQAGMLGRPRRA